jgi:hypothetical protein
MKLFQIVRFALEVQTLRERATMLRYTYIAYLVDLICSGWGRLAPILYSCGLRL